MIPVYHGDHVAFLISPDLQPDDVFNSRVATKPDGSPFVDDDGAGTTGDIIRCYGCGRGWPDFDWQAAVFDAMGWSKRQKIE